jgi:uroporphyrinogen-III synthase
LFEIEPVPWDAPDPRQFDALLLTSANAVRHGGEKLAQLRKLPVHAVGAATADAAREAGFTVASVGDAGVDALLAPLDGRQRLLHLCGEDRRVPADTAPEITSIVVYRAKQRPTVDLSAVKGCVVLIHSPRAGRHFAELVDKAALDRSSVAIGAISPAAAEAVGDDWGSVDIAERPADEALLVLAERLCNKPLRT